MCVFWFGRQCSEKTRQRRFLSHEGLSVAQSPVHFRKSPPRCGAAFVVTTSNRLRRFNWLIVLGQAIAARGKHQPQQLLPKVMPDIETTEELAALEEKLGAVG